MEITTPKVNLLGLDRQALILFFEALGEKSFRATQVLKWIHQLGVVDFDLMTNLSKSLRALLKEKCEIRPPEVLSRHEASDGTRKWLFTVPGGSAVETVYIPEPLRATLCISSQVGCALNCSFCHTAQQGFQRNLTSHEIIGQLWVVEHELRKLGMLKGDRVVTNVVMMGMGEPLLNFDAVLPAVNLMLDDLGYGLSKRRVTISTSGVVPAIDRLAEVTDVALAVSLHAPNDPLRDELVPINRKYPIETLLKACKRYLGEEEGRRRITIEYVMLHEVNDKPEHARELIRVLKGLPSKVNLIPFNPFFGTRYTRSTDKAIQQFQAILMQAGVTTTIRKTRGDDIDAACGQLAGQVNDRTKRSERFKQSLKVKPFEAANPKMYPATRDAALDGVRS